MSIKIQSSGVSKLSQCLKVRTTIGSYKMKRAPRMPFMRNPSLKDRGLVVPGGRRQYPFQTHITRFPVFDDLNFSYFTKYARKSVEERNLYETMHELPFRGVGYQFFRNGKSLANWKRDAPIDTDKGFFPALEKAFVPTEVTFRNRPWAAKMEGVMHLNGAPAIGGVRPLAYDRGSWNYRLPSFAEAVPQHYRRTLQPSGLFEAKAAPALEPRIGKIQKREKA